MPNPNVSIRTREIGWVLGVDKGAGGQYGVGLGALAIGASTAVGDFRPFGVNHAILGGFSSFPTPGAPDTIGLYLEVSAHLRQGLGQPHLPGVIQVFMANLAQPAPNDYTNMAASGDFIGGMAEWEEFSPIAVPTPPPSIGAGLTYQFRRTLGRVPMNYVRVVLTNIGTVNAGEWNLGLYWRTSPGEVR